MKYKDFRIGCEFRTGNEKRRRCTDKGTRVIVDIYAATQNLKACQLLLGHKSIASTAHYLGVEQREALDLTKRLEM